jgi:hypothetical protein
MSEGMFIRVGVVEEVSSSLKNVLCSGRSRWDTRKKYVLLTMLAICSDSVVSLMLSTSSPEMSFRMSCVICSRLNFICLIPCLRLERT